MKQSLHNCSLIFVSWNWLNLSRNDELTRMMLHYYCIKWYILPCHLQDAAVTACSRTGVVLQAGAAVPVSVCQAESGGTVQDSLSLAHTTLSSRQTSHWTAATRVNTESTFQILNSTSNSNLVRLTFVQDLSSSHTSLSGSSFNQFSSNFSPQTCQFLAKYRVQTSS